MGWFFEMGVLWGAVWDGWENWARSWGLLGLILAGIWIWHRLGGVRRTRLRSNDSSFGSKGVIWPRAVIIIEIECSQARTESLSSGLRSNNDYNSFFISPMHPSRI